MERITCRCSWTVYPGVDCDFCGTPADEVVAFAQAVDEVLALPDLSRV